MTATAAVAAEAAAAVAFLARYLLLLGVAAQVAACCHGLPKPPPSPYAAWVRSLPRAAGAAVAALQLAAVAAGFAVAAAGTGPLLGYAAAVLAVSALVTERGARIVSRKGQA
jgi:hypothetical protein